MAVSGGGMKGWIAGGVAALLMILAEAMWSRADPPAAAIRPAAPAPAADVLPLVAPASDVTPADREARRFNRYDKDRDGRVSRDEYLAARRKAFAKLDVDGDGKLGFDEYSVKTIAKFGTADADRDQQLAAAEFATTAVTRTPRTKPVCPPTTDQSEREPD